MKRTTAYILAVAAAALAVGVIAATAGTSSRVRSDSSQAAGMAHSEHMAAMDPAAQKVSASDLRSLLGRLFGEHAALAMNATNQGISGSPTFKATATALDRNSVEISKAIGSVYGAKAAKTFLDGKFMWRAHIKFFVDYTVAKARGNKVAQAKAVRNLKTYTVRFGDFLAGATGLPKQAVRDDLLAHVLELKNQLDAYAGHRYRAAAGAYREAYAHMFMTADLVAGGIAKQKGLR